MGQVKAGKITLEIDRIGDPANPAIILIAGLGFQLIDWPRAFCETLAEKGYQVVRFDNRDVGKSQKLETLGVPDLAAVLEGKATGNFPDIPYSLDDMARDVIALMNALSLHKAHIVGMSMGGMIAQLLAVHSPERCLSLTSIMSTSGEASVSAPKPEVMAALTKAPASQEKQDIVDFGLRVNDTIGSPGFRWDRDALRDHIEACFDRGYCPTGYLRQMAAVFSAPSRRDILGKINVPTLVIHGLEDPLVPSSGGQDVADYVPHAHLELVAGMGHDLSPLLCVHLARLMVPHFNGT
ncbi:MAG: alpha/beta fold hydrolase [Sneathiella sp.]|nr:alpha/beta fold hydrolase [Sneathiella sp.]